MFSIAAFCAKPTSSLVCCQFFIRHFDVLTFADFVPADDLFIGYFLARLFIHPAHSDSIAGFVLML
jgi:hypothetical protein